MAQSTSPIKILAQPQTSYRERYYSELDPKRKRPNRFIRANRNDGNFDYPTIEVKMIFCLFYFLLLDYLDTKRME